MSILFCYFSAASVNNPYPTLTPLLIKPKRKKQKGTRGVDNSNPLFDLALPKHFQ